MAQQRLSLAITAALFLAYHALLVVTPYYITLLGLSQIVIGAVTAVFMAASFGCHAVSPLLIRVISLRPLVVASLLLLGGPAFIHPLTASPELTVFLSAIRGAGFGIGAVATATLTSGLTTPARRARAMGAYGLAASLPAIFAATGGVVVADAVGFAPAFFAAGAIAVAGVLLVHRLGPLPSPPRRVARVHHVPILRYLPISLAFGMAAMSYGASLTFLPGLLAAEGAIPAPLFVLSAVGTMAGFRIVGGRLSEAVGPHRTLVLGASSVAAAMAIVGLTDTSGGEVVIVGLLLGAGFGIAATCFHVLLLVRFSQGSHGTANAIFNLAFSGGLGFGAIAFGVGAEAVGQGLMFVLLSALQATGIAIVVFDAKRPADERPLHSRDEA